MANGNTSLRICLLQFAAQQNLTQTLTHLEQLVSKAVNQYQPRIIALPECFNFNYCADSAIIKAAAESINDGVTGGTLSKLSKQYGVFIVGSLIERDRNNFYNTSAVWDPNGDVVARHRKVHLCNFRTITGLDVCEVDKLVPGNEITTFQVDDFKCGIAICKDTVFDEFIKIYGKNGCDLMFFPSAVHVTSGDQYWDLTNRARALDNQFYVAAISPARNEHAAYVVYGHSMIVGPDGFTLVRADAWEEIVFQEIDLKVIQKARKDFLLYQSRRPEVYNKYVDK
ncbi:omega-amidase NIT2-like [Bradysia coprophila]|uniref:omega-amidase NIT2-like n=1 Tax=Bradysia coprophila TaxID=38358 RepID=UPI00187D788A|nr:omega-amidase NIT2-like [Bradysia coprophila]XP_037040607.1 omega-amidase NIT2-like [Bradysia coprophila]